VNTPALNGHRSMTSFPTSSKRTTFTMSCTHHRPAKTFFVPQGRILMTHPTKAIAHTLLRDFVKVSRGSADEGLYTEKDLADTLERTGVMDFYQTLDIDGIQVRGTKRLVLTALSRGLLAEVVVD
jgi:hypothetical protein